MSRWAHALAVESSSAQWCWLLLMDEQRMFAQNLVVGPALWSSKAAILSLYIRLFAPKKWLRVVSYFALVVMFILYWVTIPLAAIFCTPHDGGPWDRVVIYRCRTVANMSPIQGAVCVAADFFILILPLPIVFRLNLNPKKKIGLAIVFLVGVLYVLLDPENICFC